MIAAVLLILAVWFGVSALVALVTGRAIANADRLDRRRQGLAPVVPLRRS